MDLYFKRHDGQAVTCDDFLAAMADANNVDLSSLAKWCAPVPDLARACGVLRAACCMCGVLVCGVVSPDRWCATRGDGPCLRR